MIAVLLAPDPNVQFVFHYVKLAVHSAINWSSCRNCILVELCIIVRFVSQLQKIIRKHLLDQKCCWRLLLWGWATSSLSDPMHVFSVLFFCGPRIFAASIVFLFQWRGPLMHVFSVLLFLRPLLPLPLVSYLAWPPDARVLGTPFLRSLFAASIGLLFGVAP